MNKTSLSLAAALAAIVTFPGPGVAAQKKHHPWLMVRSHHETADSIPQERTEVSAKTHPKEKTSNTGKQIVSQALRYKGTKYKFGGTTQRGLDCSGLIARVWSDLKMKKIPRVSSALYQTGQPVRLAELRPGDLVFFKDTYKSGISHVGVYTGNNKFVHAANHRKGVTITRLSDPYYQLHYAGARRLY
jgi:cell wall-associated NlpC family hydrolase